MDANYRFIGPLDSAKTAYYSRNAVDESNWWIPDDYKTWLMHTTSAVALALKQILWGEIVCVPRNQYIDSPGWFNIAEFLVKSALPLFTICIHDKKLALNPNGFLVDCANQFMNVTGSSMFAMSGWPGLSPEERLKISENIIAGNNFKNMFNGIRIDSKVKAEFHYQRDVLQNTLEYLEKKFSTIENLIVRAQLPSTSTWDRITKKINDATAIENFKAQYGKEFTKDYIDAITRMKRLAKDKHKYRTDEQLKWLNQRSNLYRSIYDCDVKLRGLLLVDIDKAYDETIGESLNNGRLVLSTRSDSHLPFKMRDKHIDLLDSSSTPGGLSEKNVIIPEEVESQFGHIQGIIEKLNTPEVQEQIRHIRNIRIIKNYSLSDAQEEEQKHLAFLTDHFSNVLVKQSGKGQIIEYSYAALSFGVKVIAFHFLGEYLSDQIVPIDELGLGIIEQTAEKMLEKAGIKIFPSKEKIGKFILRKDKELMVGRLRDWLSTPPETKRKD